MNKLFHLAQQDKLGFCAFDLRSVLGLCKINVFEQWLCHAARAVFFLKADTDFIVQGQHQRNFLIFVALAEILFKLPENILRGVTNGMERLNATNDFLNQALIQRRIRGRLHHVYLDQMLHLIRRRQLRYSADQILVSIRWIPKLVFIQLAQVCGNGRKRFHQWRRFHVSQLGNHVVNRFRPGHGRNNF